MPWVGLEPTIPVYERAKTVHAFDRAATVIGGLYLHSKTPTQKEKYIHVPSGNRIHDIGAWTVQKGTHIIGPGHCDRQD
jgi:hypothetical protein